MTKTIRLALPFAAALASSAAAQTSPPTIPGLGNYSLPASEPTPVPSPTPAPPMIVPVAPQASPTPRPTRAARPTPRATSTAEPNAQPTLRVKASARPLPMPTVAPVPEMPVDSGPPLAPAATRSAPARVAWPSVPSPKPDSAIPWWPWATGAALLLALLLAWLLRRRGPREAAIGETPPTLPPEPVAQPLSSRNPVARARVELELHPRRGGLNLLSATVESEIVLRNSGDAVAEAVLVETTSLPARSGQDAELGALFARPVARPAVPAFALAPGEERRVRVVSVLPLAGVKPLVAGGRAMLVPVVAVNSTYRWADQTGQTAAAFVIGAEREGHAKLAPFWFDAPRIYEALASRAYTLAVRR